MSNSNEFYISRKSIISDIPTVMQMAEDAKRNALKTCRLVQRAHSDAANSKLRFP